VSLRCALLGDPLSFLARFRQADRDGLLAILYLAAFATRTAFGRPALYSGSIAPALADIANDALKSEPENKAGVAPPMPARMMLRIILHMVYAHV
jgi:hypothetical protein